MPFTYRRHGLVVGLALVAGLTSLLVHPAARAATLPPIATLIRGTSWRVVATDALSQRSGMGMMYQQWRLRDKDGVAVALYVGATAAVQKMVHWTGQLAYEGAGYQVVGQSIASVGLHDGSTALVSVVTVQHLADRELLVYAVIGPDGIAARSSDNLLRTAWDTLRGTDGPYYLVRVSVAQRPDTREPYSVASQLLSPVLSVLRADAQPSGL